MTVTRFMVSPSRAIFIGFKLIGEKKKSPPRVHARQACAVLFDIFHIHFGNPFILINRTGSFAPPDYPGFAFIGLKRALNESP
jgi:hypothetical protein